MPGTILVVADLATYRIILRVKLASACYDVIQAGTGAEALDMARSERPDLVLLDMAMPDMDGREVCRRLKRDPRTRAIPVVMVTAHNDPESRRTAIAAGADDFLTKPIDDTILLARLRSLLRAQSTAAELALRETTTQALGFAEPGPAPLAPPGRIGLIGGSPAEVMGWRDALRPYLPDRLDIITPAIALGRGADPQPPDVFVIAETLQRPGDGLRLMAELRARPATRHTAIVVVLAPEAKDVAATALDLGAADILLAPLDPQETALRLRAQLTRKTEADRLRAQLRDGLQLAVTDPLTDLFNRRYGLGHLARVHQRAVDRNRPYALMLVDLDRFKAVNDTHGHAAGDTVLRSVAARLRDGLRNVDLIARIGGEEFLIVLPDIGPTDAMRAADRLRRAVSAEPIALGEGIALHQTASIGLAMGGPWADGEGDSPDDVMARADRALYAAKAEGRDCTRHALPDQNAA